MNNFKGITLVELIITIVLLGIIAVFILPKLTTQGIKNDAEVMSFISNIRFIQHKSMVEGGYFFIEFDPSNDRYSLYSPNNELINMPAGKNPVKVESGLNYSGPVVDNKLYFNLWGQPESPKGNLISSRVEVIIGSYTVIIEPFSGGVYLK